MLCLFRFVLKHFHVKMETAKAKLLDNKICWSFPSFFYDVFPEFTFRRGEYRTENSSWELARRW